MSTSLKDFLKEMGLEGTHPPPQVRKPEYLEPNYYYDPRNSDGEVPF